MKSIRKIKAILFGAFYGGTFVAQMIGWTIINYVGNLGQSIWRVAGISIFMTVFSCSTYLLLQKLYKRIRGIEKKSLAEAIYEMFQND